MFTVYLLNDKYIVFNKCSRYLIFEMKTLIRTTSAHTLAKNNV